MHRFASLALKSRIDARNRAETGKSMHRFASLALKSRIDARWLCDYDLQAKPFSVAAKKISIRRGLHCRYDRSRRNHLLDCFQLLVLIIVVLVYLRLKPELFLINSSLFVLSDFSIMTLIILIQSGRIKKFWVSCFYKFYT